MYNKRQLYQIFKGVREGKDVTWYDKSYDGEPIYDALQMEQIRLGLNQAEVNVKLYANFKYSAGQMSEIRKCMMHGAKPDKILNYNLSPEKMHDIWTGEVRKFRDGLGGGIDGIKRITF